MEIIGLMLLLFLLPPWDQNTSRNTLNGGRLTCAHSFNTLSLCLLTLVCLSGICSWQWYVVEEDTTSWGMGGKMGRGWGQKVADSHDLLSLSIDHFLRFPELSKMAPPGGKQVSTQKITYSIHNWVLLLKKKRRKTNTRVVMIHRDTLLASVGILKTHHKWFCNREGGWGFPVDFPVLASMLPRDGEYYSLVSSFPCLCVSAPKNQKKMSLHGVTERWLHGLLASMTVTNTRVS